MTIPNPVKDMSYKTGVSSFYHDSVYLDGYVSLDAAGAVISTAKDAFGNVRAGTTTVDDAYTVTKTGTGEYTITLKGKFARVRGLRADVTYNATPAALWAVPLKNTVLATTADGSQTIKFVLVNASGVPTNPTAPCGFYIFGSLENR